MVRLNDSVGSALVESYYADPSNETAGAVITHFMRLGYKVASGCIPRHINYDDFGLSTDIQLSIWDALKTWDRTRSKFTTWLYRKVHNGLIDSLRRKGLSGKRTGKRYRLRSMEKLFTSLGSEYVVGLELRQCDDPIRSNSRDLIKHVVRGLPASQKMAIVLRFCEDMTQREISRAIGIRHARVCQLQKSAIKALRKRHDVVEILA